MSIRRLRERKSDFPARDWILDSGAFKELELNGGYTNTPEEYAAQVIRWSKCGNMLAATTQDYMCEPFILRKTGLTTQRHQALTIERYDTIRAAVQDAAYVMPVLQGFWPEEYVSHIRQYGKRLRHGQWVGVGSVCKRNSDPKEIAHVLMAIRKERPDLRLHGFGIKLTALKNSIVRQCLYSADSMAWSYHARMNGRDAHSWQEAARFVRAVEGQKIKQIDYQPVMF